MPESAEQKTANAVTLPFGRVSLVSRSWDGAIDVRGVAAAHHLEAPLLPLSDAARVCFPERWHPARFERVGKLFLLPAQEYVHARSDCRRQRSVVCAFRPGDIRNWFESDMQWTPARLQAGLDLRNATIRHLLSRIGQELQAPGFASAELLELLAAQIVVELARQFRDVDEAGSGGGLSPWRLRLVEARLRELQAPSSLAELAGLCGISVRQLTRGFRAARGCSISTYLAGLRLERAMALLAGAHDIQAVSRAVGFGSAAHFSQVFRRAVGQTPQQYRGRSKAGAH